MSNLGIPPTIFIRPPQRFVMCFVSEDMTTNAELDTQLLIQNIVMLTILKLLEPA